MESSELYEQTLSDCLEAIRRFDETDLRRLFSENYKTLHLFINSFVRPSENNGKMKISSPCHTMLGLASELNASEIIELLLPDNLLETISHQDDKDAQDKVLVNPNARGRDGRTPLMIAVDCNQLEAVTLLLKHYNDCNLEDESGNTALSRACKYGYYNFVQLLLPLTKVDTFNKNEETCLSIALKNHHLQIAEYLISRGASIEKARNIMRFAIFNHNVNLVTFMLKNKLNISTLREESGATPFLMACQLGYLDIAEMLRVEYPSVIRDKDGADRNILLLGCMVANVEVVTYALQHDVDINLQDIFGYSALMIICQQSLDSPLKQSNVTLILHLLLSHPEVLLNSVNKNRESCLMIACMKKKFDFVKILLSQEQIDRHLYNEDGKTASDFIDDEDIKHQLFSK